VHVEVVRKARGIRFVSFDGECDARILCNIADFPTLTHVANCDVVAHQTTPHHTHLKTSVGIDRRQMSQSPRGQHVTYFGG
jgi:hypothetical protein